MPTPGTDLQPPSPAPNATTGPLSSGAAATPISILVKKKRIAKTSGVPYPLVQVVWEDHHVSSDWKGIDELDPNPVTVWTTGWLIKENENGVVLAMALTFGDDGDVTYYTNVFTILKRTTIKMTVLQKLKPARSTPRTQP